MNLKFSSIALVMLILLCGCEPSPPKVELDEENWSKRKAIINDADSIIHGTSYLSVYSQIYNYTQKQKYNLTGTISMRNVSKTDTIYFLKADYFNTEGEKIRTYFDFPIFVKPMETIEIVIAHDDVEGGTGSNFIFEWVIPNNCAEPILEAVMNSTAGTQGMAFVTQAKRIK